MNKREIDPRLGSGIGESHRRCRSRGIPLERSSSAGGLLSAFSRVDGQPKAAKLAERLHALRVQTKRLNALLDLLRTHLREQERARAKRKLKEIRRRFSRARDRDAMQEVLGDASTKVPKSERKKVNLWMRRAFNQSCLAPNRREILRSEREIAAVLHADAFKHLADTGLQNVYINGLRRLYRKARRANQHARKKRRKKDFHESRRHTKHLKLGMEICRAARIKIADDLLQQFGGVEQALGNFRDLSMALEFARAKNAPRLLRQEVKQRRRKVLRRALQSSKKLFALSPGKFMKQALTKERAP